MYNRYIPQSDGSFQRNRIQSAQAPQQSQTVPPPPHPPTEPSCSQPLPHSQQNANVVDFLKHLLPSEFDTGDLLVVLLLLLIAGDSEDHKSSALLTLLLYLFL